MQHIPFDDINESHLLTLIADGQMEGQRIEYKLEPWKTVLPTGLASEAQSKAAKQQAKEIAEFVKDCSAFANSTGGDIVIGMDAKDGRPISLDGCDIVPDSLTTHLRNLLESNSDPSLTARMKGVPLSNGKTAFVIRIAESILAPHRVVNNGQFYQRINSDSPAMNTEQIRQAMLHRGTVYDKMRAFHEDRISQDNHAFISPLNDHHRPSFVLHILPYESFVRRISLPMEMQYLPQGLQLIDRDAGSMHFKLNMDGILGYSTDMENWPSYTQLFRNGIVEVANRSFVVGVTARGEYAEDKSQIARYELDGDGLVRGLYYQVPGYLKMIEKLGITPPIWIAISLIGMKNVCLHSRGYRHSTVLHKFDRTWLRLPEFEITDFNQDTRQIAKDACDLIWQAADFPKCNAIQDDLSCAV